ncbi:MAG: HD domain-containing protein [Dehalococcoidia bacterium]
MSSSKQINVITILARVSRLLSHQRHRGYIVGGFIRDWFLGRQTNDIDIAVDGDALNVAGEVAKSLGGKFVLLDEVNGIARVVVVEEGQQWHLDFSSFLGNVESDLARRDFTINAMAVELGQLGADIEVRLIDPFSGKEDLTNRTVRAVSEQIFETDAARLLRAVRLVAELGFTIEMKTESLIRHYSQSITKVPGERVREELLRLLSLPRAAHYLRYLDDISLLLPLIPELAESKGVEQPTVHFWDVFDHSLQTVATVEFLLREDDWEYGNEDMLTAVPWSDAIAQHLSQEVSKGSTRKALLKLAGLFHDIAKPRTKSVNNTGRARFYGHTRQGADMAAAILGRLRFSNKEISLVKSLIYHHLRPVQMSRSRELPTQRAIYRYFRDTDDAGIDILFLALADYLASRGPLVSMEEWREHCQLMNYILTEQEKQQAKVLPVKLVNGHDLINIFGLTPGPLIGKLLALVGEARASGELTTREEALALVRRELNKQQMRCKAR